mmetsp:Transcript_14900/g.50387  ORF Transcript_14900/g.50387 Transcript_14900/m.50387 type:complete len:273 (-) Transcript_14900:15-833(-)
MSKSRGRGRGTLASGAASALPKVNAARHGCDEEDHQTDDDEHHHVPHHHAALHAPEQLLGAAVEAEGLIGQQIGLVHEQLDALPALQQLLNVLHHHALDVLDALLHAPQLVARGVVVVVGHLLPERGGEAVVEAKRDGRGRHIREAAEEDLADVLKEGEDDSPLGALIAHAEEGVAVRDNVVEGVAVVDVGHAAVVGGYLAQQHARHRGEVARVRGGGVLREHHHAAGHEGVDDGHDGSLPPPEGSRGGGAQGGEGRRRGGPRPSSAAIPRT